ncbi:hypothetical protein, partial [Staphylococcus pasteuri_A]
MTPIVGTQTYTLPATLGKLYQVWINGKPIQDMGSDSMAKTFFGSTEISLGGIPTSYYVQN